MRTTLKKYQNVIIIIGVALVAFLLGSFSGNLFGATGANLSGAAGSMANAGICDASSLLGEEPTGIVLADPLNLRVGPGLEYHVVTQLDYCTSLSLTGRTSDSAWLEIQLPGNVAGWVYSYYIKANINISDLEVTTGFGGADTSPSTTAGQRDVSVIIQTNQAVAFVTGMPADVEISAVLSPEVGSGNGLTVASGWTDALGNATLTFTMPATWADGSDLESGSMTLKKVSLV